MVTNAWPELMPTVARNRVSPKFRSTMFAGSGMTQEIVPVLPQPSQNECNDQRPAADAKRHRSNAGDRYRYQPQQHAEHHPETNGDIAEFGHRPYRVAEIGASGSNMLWRHKDTYSIAHLQNEVRRWHEIHVVAPHMQYLHWCTRRHDEICETHAGQIGFGNEEALIRQVSAILRNPPRIEPAERLRRPRDCFLFIGGNQQRVAGANLKTVVQQAVALLLPNPRNLHALGQ